MIKRFYNIDGSLKYSISISGNIKTVLDSKGAVLGRIINGETFDSNGRKVSFGEDVSVIIN